ncbi:DUF1127 domain-containing protein [Nereida sp. MMG025]|uniref:DUF1127 domain-containing protein n=1 Tax=Nereida sp. MMG025 TaxID=2909981 RepID=UPI001F298E15|nr:DUF1127 domain-containing protein [Nereida sp. MMG025]MCF6443947.1 DUF1127 domain-containing protein [Nereida sp. MMG025]
MTTFSTNMIPARPAPRAGFSITRAFDAYRSRRALAALTAEQLADVGLTRQDALTEAARPVWDVPTNWRS